jgi:hypothetical protein
MEAIAISDCWIYAGRARAATSAIRIESGGGPKIVNCKINAASDSSWVNGIDLAAASSIQTGDLLVSNCSIENFTGAGIKGTTSAGVSWWINILLTGNQIFPGYGGTQYGINLAATTAGDFNGVSITGNQGSISSSSSPFIRLTNCTNVDLTGNAQCGFSDMVTFGRVTLLRVDLHWA